MVARYGVDIFGTDGTLVSRYGDISGLGWGGSDYTLPEGSWGLWGKRDGVWIKAMVQMFYSHFGPSGLITYTITIGPIILTGLISFTITVNEAMPFGTIIVPKGRIVTLENFLYDIPTLQVSRDGGVYRSLSNRRLISTVLRASLNGGAVTSYNVLSGPTVSGENTYTSVAVRIQIGGEITVTNENWTTAAVQTDYLRTLRMFAHEVNAVPTFSGVNATQSNSGISGGKDKEGGNFNQGGGSGTDAGGYGGNCIIAGTMVTTPHGLRVVESLRIGQRIVSPLPNGTLVHAVLKSNRTARNNEVLEINGDLSVTLRQPLYTRKGWREARFLTRRDWVMRGDGTWTKVTSLRHVLGVYQVYSPISAPGKNFVANGYLLQDKNILI